MIGAALFAGAGDRRQGRATIKKWPRFAARVEVEARCPREGAGAKTGMNAAC